MTGSSKMNWVLLILILSYLSTKGDKMLFFIFKKEKQGIAHIFTTKCLIVMGFEPKGSVLMHKMKGLVKNSNWFLKAPHSQCLLCSHWPHDICAFVKPVASVWLPCYSCHNYVICIKTNHTGTHNALVFMTMQAMESSESDEDKVRFG